MGFLTRTQQQLLISMYDNAITRFEQKVYKHPFSFYKNIWKLRDMELVKVNGEVEHKGRKYKKWGLTLDGIFLVRMLRKGR